MLTEIEEAVDMNGVDGIADCLGDIWTDFKLSLPPEHAKIYVEGFNLTLLSFPDSLLPVQINELIIDEQPSESSKTQILRNLITDNIMVILRGMGFTLDPDYADREHLQEMITLVNLVYELRGCEDLVGVADLLDCTDIPPMDRLIGVMKRYLGEDVDTEIYRLVVSDVSEVLLKALRDGIENLDNMDSPPQEIIDRVIANKPLFHGTLAWDHVTQQGPLGSPIDSLLRYYDSELQKLIVSENDKDVKRYGLNVIAFFLISEINNEQLQDRILRYFDEVISDIEVSMVLEEVVKKLEFTHDKQA